MALILNLDTSTRICSVALARDGELIGWKESNEDRSHASLLSLFIKQILEESSIDISDLEAVAVSKGPGSYTGLRIGVSTAKGLAYAAGIPLISVDTLTALAHGVMLGHHLDNKEYTTDETFYLCPMIDARRMEVYTATFQASGKMVQDVSAKIINEDSCSRIKCEVIEETAVDGRFGLAHADLARDNPPVKQFEYCVSAAHAFE